MSSSTSEKLADSKADILKKVRIYFSTKRCELRKIKIFHFSMINSFSNLLFFYLLKNAFTWPLQSWKRDWRSKNKISFYTKKSAKDTHRLRLKREYKYLKQDGRYLIKFNLLFIWFLYIIDKFQAKSEISTPIEATESPSPLFKINYFVQLIPNIFPGCHPIQSVKDFRSAVELKYEGA